MKTHLKQGSDIKLDTPGMNSFSDVVNAMTWEISNLKNGDINLPRAKMIATLARGITAKARAITEHIRVTGKSDAIGIFDTLFVSKEVHTNPANDNGKKHKTKRR